MLDLPDLLIQTHYDLICRKLIKVSSLIMSTPVGTSRNVSIGHLHLVVWEHGYVGNVSVHLHYRTTQTLCPAPGRPLAPSTCPPSAPGLSPGWSFYWKKNLALAPIQLHQGPGALLL